MSEYLHVERPFLDQRAALGWTVVDQGKGMVPSEPVASLCAGSRASVRTIKINLR